MSAGAFLYELLAVLIAASICIVVYFKHAFKYWEKRKVPYLEPVFPKGNTLSVLNRGLSVGILTSDFYKEFKRRGCRFGGVYTGPQPALVLVDLELIKTVMSKDFNHFTDRGIYYNEKSDPLTAHLFNVDGAKWRRLRVKLTPTFTSGKMKMMFQTVADTSKIMTDALDNSIDRNSTVDIKEVVSCFATDVIGSCAFGINCNSFKDPDAEFRKLGRELFLPHFWSNLRRFIALMFPKFCKFIGFTTLRKDLSSFFYKAVEDVVTHREKTGYRRNDFLQLIIDMKNQTQPTKGENNNKGAQTPLTMNELAAQALVFYIAGFETSSTVMHFCLYELARFPDIQNKVREEVLKVLEKYGGEFTYDALGEMKYTQQVIDEALRKYPPLPNLNRRCALPYKVPDSDLVVEKEINVLISAYGIHHDPDYYPDPEKFDPERFSEENKTKIPSYAYLPFGEGPRNCIGLRFGLMQFKIGLAALLSKFEFSVGAKTEPPQFDKTAFLLQLKNTIYLDIKRIGAK